MPRQQLLPIDQPTRILVSGVRHRTHWVYVSSWLRVAAEASPDVALIVRNLDAEERPVASELGVLAHLPQNVFTDDSPTQIPWIYLAVGSPSLPRLLEQMRSLGRPLAVVVVDEGVGSYANAANLRRAMRREGHPLLRSFVKSWTRTLGRDSPLVLRWPTFWDKGRNAGETRWLPNRAVAEEFAVNVDCSTDAFDVVVLAQPWVELGLVAIDGYLGWLDSIESVAAANNRDVTVWLHPRNDPRYFRSFKTQKGQPAELARSVRTANLVVGENSTALLNLGALAGTACLRCVGNASAPVRLLLSDRQRSLFSQFVDQVNTTTALERVLQGRP